VFIVSRRGGGNNSEEVSLLKKPVVETLQRSESRTFYADVQGKMVYVTITKQDIPHVALAHGSAYASVGEYLKMLSGVVDAS